MVRVKHSLRFGDFENLSFSYRHLWTFADPPKFHYPNGGNPSLTYRNDQLGVDLRSTIGVGGGRILTQSNSVIFVLEGGLGYSAENVAGGEQSARSWESYARLRWDWFRYDLPELDLSSSLVVFPNLTDSGRVRSEYNINFRWEFIDDFFWSLRYWSSRDNRPTDPDASTIDYGINTSLGWDF